MSVSTGKVWDYQWKKKDIRIKKETTTRTTPGWLHGDTVSFRATTDSPIGAGELVSRNANGTVSTARGEYTTLNDLIGNTWTHRYTHSELTTTFVGHSGCLMSERGDTLAYLIHPECTIRGINFECTAELHYESAIPLGEMGDRYRVSISAPAFRAGIIHAHCYIRNYTSNDYGGGARTRATFVGNVL